MGAALTMWSLEALEAVPGVSRWERDADRFLSPAYG